MKALAQASGEFRCLVELLRAGASGGKGRAADLVSGPLDWRELERLLVEHKVLLPAWRELQGLGGEQGIPFEARQRLATVFRGQVLRQLKLAAGLVEVVQAFDAAGLPYLALKGPALSQSLFADPAARHAGDLDLLIGRESFDAAVSALRALGYRLESDPVEARAERGAERWSLSHHSHYVRGDQQVELHWRLSDLDFLYPVSFERLYQRRQQVGVGGHAIDMLGEADLVPYLTLHGTAHCWNRAKWIYDLAVIRATRPELWEAGADGASSMKRACVARDRLLELLFPEDAPDSTAAKRRAGALPQATRLAARRLVSRDLYPGSWRNVLGRSWAIVTLCPDLGSRCRYLSSLLSWAPCYERFPLPKALGFAYVALGPLYWLWLQAKRRVSRPDPPSGPPS